GQGTVGPCEDRTRSAKAMVEEANVRREGRRDWNDRGRGRTVETQSGGLAVLRALQELVDRKAAWT
ncbi:MAG: hypothetical protein M1830_000669, partial [Pleopsidium flavum]